jgi:transposase-like protein
METRLKAGSNHALFTHLMRKRHNTEFTSKAVHDLLKKEKLLSQIASDHGVYPNQFRQWKA